MRPSRIGVVALLAAVIIAPTLHAQFAGLQVGARVRVELKAGTAKPTVYAVYHVTDDTLVLMIPGHVGLYSLSAAQMNRLELSHPIRPMWSKTAPLWVTAMGAGILGTVSYETDDPGDFFSAQDSFYLGAILGGAIGLIVGTSIAFAHHADRWEPVPLAASESRSSSRPALYVSPNTRGVRVGVSLTR